ADRRNVEHEGRRVGVSRVVHFVDDRRNDLQTKIGLSGPSGSRGIQGCKQKEQRGDSTHGVLLRRIRQGECLEGWTSWLGPARKARLIGGGAYIGHASLLTRPPRRPA